MLNDEIFVYFLMIWNCIRTLYLAMIMVNNDKLEEKLRDALLSLKTVEDQLDSCLRSNEVLKEQVKNLTDELHLCKSSAHNKLHVSCQVSYNDIIEGGIVTYLTAHIVLAGVSFILVFILFSMHILNSCYGYVSVSLCYMHCRDIC